MCIRIATKAPRPRQLQIRYKKRDHRYVVYLGDDIIGFVKKEGREWNAVDSFIAQSVYRPSRDQAGAWVKCEFERAAKEGRINPATAPPPQRGIL